VKQFFRKKISLISEINSDSGCLAAGRWPGGNGELVVTQNVTSHPPLSLHTVAPISTRWSIQRLVRHFQPRAEKRTGDFKARDGGIMFWGWVTANVDPGLALWGNVGATLQDMCIEWLRLDLWSFIDTPKYVRE
jgi:hypothetical protein